MVLYETMKDRKIPVDELESFDRLYPLEEPALLPLAGEYEGLPYPFFAFGDEEEDEDEEDVDDDNFDDLEDDFDDDFEDEDFDDDDYDDEDDDYDFEDDPDYEDFEE